MKDNSTFQCESSDDPLHTHIDPLWLSDRTTFKFPARGAASLGTQRGERYDDFLCALDEAELRFRELASIMGMWSYDDDTPSAA